MRKGVAFRDGAARPDHLVLRVGQLQEDARSSAVTRPSAHEWRATDGDGPLLPPAWRTIPGKDRGVQPRITPGGSRPGPGSSDTSVTSELSTVNKCGYFYAWYDIFRESRCNRSSAWIDSPSCSPRQGPGATWLGKVGFSCAPTTGTATQRRARFPRSWAAKVPTQRTSSHGKDRLLGELHAFPPEAVSDQPTTPWPTSR
jgi:hypothetical protein